MDITQLIQATKGSNKVAEKAAVQLISIGMPAVPGIIDAIRNNQGAAWLLGAVLAEISHPDLVPVLAGFLQEENLDVRIAAFDALGLSGDERALQPLLKALSDSRRKRAVSALGALGNPNAIGKLLEIAREILDRPFAVDVIEGKPGVREEDFDRFELITLIDVVIALAKLGNYEIAPVAIPLTRYDGKDIDDSNAPYIRHEAVRTLQYAVLPGVFHALQVALRDSDADVRLAAVDAAFYLGVREAISELISCLQDENPMVLNNVLASLHGLTGECFEEDATLEELQGWWRQHEGDYDHGVCYRLGKPLYIPDIIALLADRRVRRSVSQELKVITGRDFGYNPDIPTYSGKRLMARAQRWWKAEGHRFERGALYKYGQKQDMELIFEGGRKGVRGGSKPRRQGRPVGRSARQRNRPGRSR